MIIVGAILIGVPVPLVQWIWGWTVGEEEKAAWRECLEIYWRRTEDGNEAS